MARASEQDLVGSWVRFSRGAKSFSGLSGVRFLLLPQGSHSIEKFWNFRRSHWKVVEFHFPLKSFKIFVEVLEKSLNFLQLWVWWPGKCLLMLFGCPRQNINHSSENLKVMYIKRSMFYAIVTSSQVKLTSLRQGSPISHCLVSKGALRKLWLHVKNLKRKSSLKLCTGIFKGPKREITYHHNLFKVKKNKRAIEVTWELY